MTRFDLFLRIEEDPDATLAQYLRWLAFSWGLWGLTHPDGSAAKLLRRSDFSPELRRDARQLMCASFDAWLTDRYANYLGGEPLCLTTYPPCPAA